ncbi:VWA domain-containing protein [Seongchinamella sediminis]|uniref:VWA domain-containing protein n=1 Tax=Seongchinamella sediminis TaxID=2283635 RepID=A0A3L7E122_9GAMM|nr:VWA domain-containing protein [Seongchinamella sediminis]RLQ21822.1 VWA domain-containing protein [Seongchinamella sediminis]
MLPELPALEYFHLLRPGWLLLLVPAVALNVYILRRQDSSDMFSGIIAPHLLEHLRLDRRQSRWFNPATVSALFTLLIFIIILGPSLRQQPSPLSQDESALVLLLDLSRSMEQTDIQPSRLARARQKASDLLALRPDKQSALVVYAGTAHTVLTLTADQDILTQYLAALKPGMMPRAGKFAERALPLVDEILRDTTAAATVVLISDGVGSNTRDAFADYFSARSHQLLVLGMGSDSDEDGIVPLDRAGLQAVASSAGGHYLDVTVDDSDVRALERRIESHYVVIDDDALPWLDSGYPLVFLCLPLWLLWFRKGWTIAWGWLLLPLVLAGSPAPVTAAGDSSEQAPVTEEHAGAGIGQWFAGLWLTPDQQGRLLLQAGRYRAAARQFQDPLWKGIAHYYNEDFMQAAEYFSRSDSNDALFNEANARAHARDFLRAVNRYDQLLQRDPDYPGARENRDKVQALIDEINRMSESQTPEAGIGSEEKEMGGDDAIPAEGAEELSFDQVELKHYSAEEILQSQATRDMWLRGVQQDPSNFLATKFSMQLQRREAP